MDLNQVYFDTLFEKFLKNEQVTLVLHQPEKNINSNVICIPIASEEDLEAIEIKNYEELNLVNTEACSKFEYTLIKMQAGLGSSVLRSDLIQKIEKRTELGAKGTDLYFKINNEFNSISAIQLLQANALSEKKIYKKINYKNLVNDETKEAVTKSIEKVILGPLCELQAEYFQRKMPTIDEGGELTTERRDMDLLVIAKFLILLILR
jgi:isochorismate synthase EntC